MTDSLGELALSEGDYPRARSLFEESLALCREMNNRRRIAYELRNLGHVARFEQDFTSARAYYVESLTHYRDLDAKPGIANLLDAFARLATAQNRMERAARLFGAADALRVSINASVPPLERKDHEEGVVAARDALGEEAFAAAWAAGKAMALEQAIAYARDHPPGDLHPAIARG
jgi:uncharacterized protein HemY